MYVFELFRAFCNFMNMVLLFFFERQKEQLTTFQVTDYCTGTRIKKIKSQFLLNK